MSEYLKELEPRSEEELKRTKEHKEALRELNLNRDLLLNIAATAWARGDMLQVQLIKAIAESMVYKVLSAPWLRGLDTQGIIEWLGNHLTVDQAAAIDIAIGEDMRRRAPLLKNQQAATDANADLAEQRHIVVRDLADMEDPTGELRKKNCSHIIRKVEAALPKDPRFKTVFSGENLSPVQIRRIITNNQK